jgi:cytochrome P450
MKKKTKQRAPGPRGKLLGKLDEARKDPLRLFLELAMEFGGVVRFRVAHIPFFLVSDLDAIKRILQDNLKNYVKGVSYEHLRTAMGNGLLVAEGDLWKRQRKLIQPAFTRQKLADSISTMTGSISGLVKSWEEPARTGEVLDVVSPFMRLAFDMVGKILMGKEIDDKMDLVESVLNEAGDHVYHRMESPFRVPEAVPTKRNRRYKAALKTLYGVVDDVIAKHRSEESETFTLLSTMVRARDEETGEGMSDQQLRDEVLTFLMAGHETTGDALCWVFYLLSMHPGACRILGQEVDRVLGKRVPTIEEVPSLVYTGQVIDEAMRLYPPAWAFTRTAVARDELKGYPVPAGSNIIICPHVNHRLPELWDHPEAFDPDRFAPDRQEKRHIYAYFPFGGGPHTCIGRHFSLLEMKLAVAMISQRYRLELVPGQRIEAAPRISLRPSDEIRMKILPRKKLTPSR